MSAPHADRQDAAPLQGVRVLDFGQFIAGPLCAALLADLGADVIRIERPGGAADRFVQPVGEDVGGAVYWQMNRNKRSLALDVFSPACRDVVDRLIATADIIVVNVPPKTLTAMGLDYERIAAINPRAVVSVCTAYGREGSLADQPGFDGVGQAMSGAMHLSGEGGVPRKSYCHWVDHMSACLSAFGILAALRERDDSGRGQNVDVSLIRTAVFAMASNLVEEERLQVGRQGQGNRAQLAGPADVYRTRDGFVLLQVIGAAMFSRCAKLVGRPDWLADARYADDESRGAHGADLSAFMAEFCARFTTEECLKRFRSAGLPCAPVLDLAAVLADENLRQGGLWRRRSLPGAPEPHLVIEPPVVLSRTPASVRDGAPALGMHTEEILSELGLDRAAQLALFRAGHAGAMP